MEFTETLLIGVLGSIISFYLCKKFFPFLGNIIVKYPFQSFVIFSLIVIMTLLAALIAKQL